MLAQLIAPALVLLSSSLTLAAPAPVADAAFEIVEAGFPEQPSVLSRLLLRRKEIKCHAGGRAIGIRGSSSIRGQNPMASLAHLVAAWKGDSFGSDLNYPALTYTDIQVYVTQSVDVGIEILTQRITNYVDACPGHQIALMGFSQGAQVLGDVLIGNSHGGAPGLAQKYLDALTVVVQFGDPAYVPGYAFDTGSPTSTTAGSVDRQNSQLYVSTGLASKMVSYCDMGDRWCSNQQWANSGDIHNSEPQTHWNEAVAFIQSKLH